MLSEIVSSKKLAPKLLLEFEPPAPIALQGMIEERKRQLERERIIKGGAEDPLETAKKEANRILAEAQDARKAAEVEVEKLKAGAAEEVRREIESECATRLQAATAETQKRFSDSLFELATLKDEIYGRLEKQLLEMTLLVLRKILPAEVRTAPETILIMLRRGFAKIKKSENTEITVNPSDYEILLQHQQELREITGNAAGVKFVKDEAVERGGCRIKTESGEIEAEPGRQLETVWNELLEDNGL